MSEGVQVAMIAVLGTTIPALLGLLGIYVQNRRLSNAQRDDHAATATKVDALVAGQAEIKADLRDVKDEVRSHGDRLRHLEHWNVLKDENTTVQDTLTDIADQLNNRKRSA